MSEFIGGYLFEEENHAMLAQMDDAECVVSLMRYAGDLPSRFSLRDKVPVRNQHQEGACNGFGMRVASVVNHLYASGGTFQEYAGDALYYLCQRVDRISGDRGSTVSGGLQVLRNIGSVRIEDFPETPQYDPQRLPSNVNQLAAPFKVQKTAILRTIPQIKEWLGLGVGGCWYGCRWGFRFDGRGGVTSWSPSGGGHATGIIGYDDSRGLLECINSWGTQWQGGGYYTVPYRIFESVLRDSATVVAGASDMSDVKPRNVDWVRESINR